MSSAGIVVSHIAAWAPGLASPEDWKQWAAGAKQIERVKDAPKIEYTDPLFRRRLSQISRMTIEVVHRELEEEHCSPDMKQVFVSTRGEIAREFSVSTTLIEEKMILPASFSLSVFNTPIALASLAFHLRAGYSVLYPSKGNFRDAFLGACAPVLSGCEKQIMLVYADELPPAEYDSIRSENCTPLAFAAILSASGDGMTISDPSGVPSIPEEFLRELLKRG